MHLYGYRRIPGRGRQIILRIEPGNNLDFVVALRQIPAVDYSSLVGAAR